MKIVAIIPAAGSGKRFKSKTPKPFFVLNGKPLIIHTLTALRRAFKFSELIVATSPANIRRMKRVLKAHGFGRARVIRGGSTRSESVFKALAASGRENEYALVHDAARPLVSKKIVRELLKEAKRSRAAICAVGVSSTVKRVDEKSKTIVGTQDRRNLYLAQTPQVFRRDLLLGRYKKLGKAAFRATDEAQLFDGSGIRVKIVPGEAKNIKLTTPEDVQLFHFYAGV